ncbi:MAG: hypothetical protein ACK5N8_04475 [Alphaproteobacteria bacterium]
MFKRKRDKKVVLSRTVCLGQFVWENLYSEEYEIINHCKNRIDYCLKINDKPDLVVDYDEVSSYVINQNAEGNIYRKNMLFAETKDIFKYTKTPMLIMDSFSELTDKLFINKQNEKMFLFHYKDLIHDSDFDEKYECLGLLPIDEIKNYYNLFFERVINVYGKIPIIYMHFPMDFEVREEYQKRVCEILGAINELQKKYDNLISITADTVEENLVDKNIYHFSQNTYYDIAKKIDSLNLGWHLNLNKDSFLYKYIISNSLFSKKMKLFITRIILNKRKRKYCRKIIKDMYL